MSGSSHNGVVGHNIQELNRTAMDETNSRIRRALDWNFASPSTPGHGRVADLNIFTPSPSPYVPRAPDGDDLQPWTLYGFDDDDEIIPSSPLREEKKDVEVPFRQFFKDNGLEAKLKHIPKPKEKFDDYSQSHFEQMRRHAFGAVEHILQKVDQSYGEEMAIYVRSHVATKLKSQVESRKQEEVSDLYATIFFCCALKLTSRREDRG